MQRKIAGRKPKTDRGSVSRSNARTWTGVILLVAIARELIAYSSRLVLKFKTCCAIYVAAAHRAAVRAVLPACPQRSIFILLSICIVVR